MRGDRRLTPGERRRGVIIPVPHTRSGRKTALNYIQALRPIVSDIAASLDVPKDVHDLSPAADQVGAAYLGAFLDELARRLEGAA